MARYTGPKCKLCRREEVKLFLKGSRCESNKCAIERRGYPPGPKPQRRRRKSDYAVRLREKQKAKRIYGVLEKQFRRYFETAERIPGNTGVALLQLLERRLDNVVYHLGWATSRAQGRQVVRHGHIRVNGRKVDIPSYQVSQGDVIAVKAKNTSREMVERHHEESRPRMVPTWLESDPDDLKARVLNLPERDDITTEVDEQLIVEISSR